MSAAVEVSHSERSAGSSVMFRHAPELDGFRGLAIILVLFGHALEYSSTSLGQPVGSSVAQLGVLLFFVLSGFLITGVLYRECDRSRTINLKYFYMRRVLRLGPALLLFLFVCSLLVEKRAITDVWFSEFVICLFYLRNIYGSSVSLGHLWSLSLEEQFYLGWPWVMKYFRGGRLLLYATAATVGITTFRMIAIRAQLFPYDTGVFYERPWFRFDSILAGCCLMLLQHAPIKAIFNNVIRRIPTSLAWAILVTWTIWGERLSRTAYITFQLAGALVVLWLLVISTQSTTSLLFNNTWLRYAGKISYSLYLWQQLFLVTQYPSWSYLRAFPINILAPICCSTLELTRGGLGHGRHLWLVVGGICESFVPLLVKLPAPHPRCPF